ncbi:MAG: polyprenyl synthetase family protein [Candidatus Cryptobacteroides sp.]
MKLNDIKTLLGEDWTKMEQGIRNALKSDIGLLEKVNESILSNSGKMLRPMISLLVAKACAMQKEIPESAIAFASASELLHNATLLHDDVADDSEQRRGNPTIKHLMGPSVSVLLGDYWLVKAMGKILEDEKHGFRVIKLFSKTLSDLAEGEMLQLQKADECDTLEEDYIRIIFCKTASLFEASALSAAIAADASAAMEDAVTRYSVALGLAFQIRDDIFDYAPGVDVGKPVGVDILERKITAPLLGAFANRPDMEAEIRGKIASIDGFDTAVRDEIVAFVRENGGLEAAQQMLERYVSGAVEAIGELPESQWRDCLENIARYVGRRNE